MAGLGSKFAKQLFHPKIEHKPFVCRMLCKNYFCSIPSSNQKRPLCSALKASGTTADIDPHLVYMTFLQRPFMPFATVSHLRLFAKWYSKRNVMLTGYGFIGIISASIIFVPLILRLFPIWAPDSISCSADIRF